jgi:hypothetical protein
MTRYDRAQLLGMRDLPLSRQRPQCFYEARVFKLNILRLDGQEERDRLISERVKLLQENLRTIYLQNWNSTIFQNCQNYHSALLCPPNMRQTSPPPPNLAPMFHNQKMQFNQQPPAAQGSQRRASFGGDPQHAGLDKILPYDRK